MPLGTQAGLGPGEIVLDGEPSPPKREGEQRPRPQFSAHVCCYQTAPSGCLATIDMGQNWGLCPLLVGSWYPI